ncbi:MmcQ/YjbR family DNA-binding protein [Conexibacter woesei]|uniref:Phosphoribosylglycinamide formyltransferase n=1 Tax=Conexibacter woesei (strain DSM 14684 / CCUG 47730 / CIP 108061 / JCM 11494 / NBRC 100937 / ID131577) TaxID=469383 RepID=D3F5S5_CONWI|nr:MmcQ/YjbR family DNA-binding protein [Conexibacter woesei]ADB52624.1 hypothetical protein Cwoe_4210 [Conexibacter woesei DSM 14684]
MDAPADDDAPLVRLSGICARLPEAAQQRTGYHHAEFRVWGKAFAYLLDDGGGAGVAAVIVRGRPGALKLLQARGADAAERFFSPPYLGARGWIGLRLDRATPDWEEIAALVVTSYRSAAPDELIERLDCGDAA